MRTGSQRGFTYLAVLFLVALTAAGLAALGQAWSTAVQREKERELEFRGREIARAIASYVRASAIGSGSAAYPGSLDELLVDRRGATPRHHLRRRYADPFTGEPDWVLIEAPGDPQRFHGVRSRSTQQLLRRRGPHGTPIDRAEDWEFLAQAHAQRPREAAAEATSPSVPVFPTLPSSSPAGSQTQ